MSSDLLEQDQAPVNTSELLTGILDDLQILVEKQFQLLKSQIEQEIRRRLFGAVLVAIGVGVLMISFTVASLAFAHGLDWSLNSRDRGDVAFPAWASELVVAVALLVLAALLARMGQVRLKPQELRVPALQDTDHDRYRNR